MKAAGIDLGYAATKVVSDGIQTTFPSIVGTPDKARFKLTGDEKFTVIEVDGKAYNVGYGAVEQSRFTARQEDRGWIRTREYQVLLHAALSALQPTGGALQVTVVTGLPVAFFDEDKEAVKKLFQQTHAIRRQGSDLLNVTVTRCVVIPQVMGTALNEALDDDGLVANAELATGHVGVIDIGGKTTNFLHAHQLGDQATETDSISLGAWDAVRALRDPIQSVCPGVDYKDHELSDAIVNGAITYKGNQIDLSELLNGVLDPMAAQLVAKARQLWPGEGAKLDAILLTGGGAYLLGGRIMQMIDHGNMRMVEDSVFANARGYYKLATRAGRGG